MAAGRQNRNCRKHCEYISHFAHFELPLQLRTSLNGYYMGLHNTNSIQNNRVKSGPTQEGAIGERNDSQQRLKSEHCVTGANEQVGLFTAGAALGQKDGVAYWGAVVPSLTLDYGVRCEYNRLPPTLPQDALNFSPRFGLAWTRWKSTVVRTGFGLF